MECETVCSPTSAFEERLYTPLHWLEVALSVKCLPDVCVESKSLCRTTYVHNLIPISVCRNSCHFYAFEAGAFQYSLYISGIYGISNYQ